MDNQPLHMSEAWREQRISKAEAHFAKLKRRCDAGDDGAVMEALHFAGSFDVPPPKWVMQAFTRVYEGVRGVDAKYHSWDQAFGSPHPAGQKLRGVRNQWKASMIFFEIDWRSTMENRTIDLDLFEEVGKQFGVGRSTCATLYGEIKKLVDARLSASEKTSGKV